MQETSLYQSLVVTGTKGSKRVNALLDTGADSTIISQKLAEEIGVTMHPSGIVIRDASGTEIDSHVAKIKINIRGKQRIIEVLIPSQNLTNEMIIGSDFFQQTDAVIDYKHDKLRF